MIRAFDTFSLPLLRWIDPEDAHRVAIQDLRARADGSHDVPELAS